MTHPPNVAFITAQPQQYNIHSNFGMFPGERLLYHTKMKTGCCKRGDHYITSVTDTRYVVRKEPSVCCCCKRSYMDTCIYLKDIAQLDEIQHGICCATKRLQLYGSFGSHIIHIDDKEISDFELLITEAIAQHKLIKQ